MYGRQRLQGLERKFAPPYGVPYYDLSKKIDADTLIKARLWKACGVVDQQGRYFDLGELYFKYHKEAIQELRSTFGPDNHIVASINVGNRARINDDLPVLNYKNKTYTEDELWELLLAAPDFCFENIANNDPVILTQELCNAIYNIASQTPLPNYKHPLSYIITNCISGLGFAKYEILNTCYHGESYQYKVNLKNLNTYLNDTTDEAFPYKDTLETLDMTRIEQSHNLPPTSL